MSSDSSRTAASGEGSFAALLGRPRTEQTFSDTAADLKGHTGDQDWRTDRSCVVGQLRLRSPRRRRVQRPEVAGADGAVLHVAAGVARERARQWGPVLSVSVGISASARDRFLVLFEGLRC